MAGKAWDRQKVGPRSSALPTPPEPDDIADPAQGAKVARCGACGMPNPKPLIGLWAGVLVRFPLCGRCVHEHNRPYPRDTDPLRVA